MMRHSLAFKNLYFGAVKVIKKPKMSRNVLGVEISALWDAISAWVSKGYELTLKCHGTSSFNFNESSKQMTRNKKKKTLFFSSNNAHIQHRQRTKLLINSRI